MRWVAPLLAIVSIAGLEALALMKGIDGSLFTIAIAAIAGLGGYLVHGQLKRK